MARRLQAASPAVQAVLQVKLAEALRALREGEVVDAGAPVQQMPRQVETATQEAPSVGSVPAGWPAARPEPRKPGSKAPAEPAPPAAPLSLLGRLNHHLQTVSSDANPGDSHTVPTGGAPTRPPDLKSVVRFREAWARISAETEVDRAAHRAPENAGPLNAHNLVLRTLGHMRELSPDYLRRFMNHAESLMWLDHAVGQLKQPASKAKSAKAGKSRK
jgi:hypothetical protein